MGYRVGNKQLIKKMNQVSILELIRDAGPISRADIVKKINLTSATVSANTSELIEQGLVQELGIGESSGGRRPVLLTVDRDNTAVLGVDIHKTSVSCGLVDLMGNVLCSCDKVFSEKDLRYEQDILYCINEMLGKRGERTILGIGVGMCGVIDKNRCVSLFAPSQPLVNFDLKSYIEKETGLAVCLDNDANAMALGEKWFGTAKKAQNYLFLSIGQGIGSGVVIDGEIYHGSGFAAGEIGHIRVVEKGKKCVCGKYGCLDTVGTENALFEQIREGLAEGSNSILAERHADFTREDIWSAAKSGDELVLSTLHRIGRYIGKTVSYVINLMNPDHIIIGGNMSLFGEFMLDAIKEEALRLSMNECVKDTQFVISSLGDDAGVIGAATLFVEDILGY